MTGKPRPLLIILLLIASVAASARAEKIRTSIPGANLNYLSVYSADERHFFRDEGLGKRNHRHRRPRRYRRPGERRRRFQRRRRQRSARSGARRAAQSDFLSDRKTDLVFGRSSEHHSGRRSQGQKDRRRPARRQRRSLHHFVRGTGGRVGEGFDPAISGHEHRRQNPRRQNRRGVGRGSRSRRHGGGGTRGVAQAGFHGRYFHSALSRLRRHSSETRRESSASQKMDSRHDPRRCSSCATGPKTPPTSRCAACA